MGRRLPGLFVAATLAVAQTIAAAALAGEFAFPTTEFVERARSASVSQGAVTATITMRRDAETGVDVPVLTVAVDGQAVVSAEGIESGFDFPVSEASIAEIDPDNRHPEIYFTSYFGGAHCCSAVIVATEVGAGWVALPVGEFDGDGDYLDDVDHDGLAEVVTVDNRFLYRFDCYACSAAPLVVYTVRGGRVVDVSAEPRYLAAHRDWLALIEEGMGAERWRSPGFLAGWLATKVRVGEGAAAWAEINARWNFAEDPGEQTCLTGGQPEDCAKGDLRVLKFPDRLLLFLHEAGYRF